MSQPEVVVPSGNSQLGGNHGMGFFFKERQAYDLGLITGERLQGFTDLFIALHRAIFVAR